MEIQLVRNATMRIKYGGMLIVTDPFLSPKHTMESFAGISPNPTVDLPMSPQDAIAGADLVIVSHLHPDHIDPVAIDLLPKAIPLLCQPGDEMTFKRAGFSAVEPVEMEVERGGVSITRTPGQHGTGMWAQQMGAVSGFVLSHPTEPTVYWTGDTILYRGVTRALELKEPQVIITHSCGAEFPGSGPIVMDAQQTVALCQIAPEATVVAVHMEALDHAKVSRQELRDYADKKGVRPDRLLIPADGETVSF